MSNVQRPHPFIQDPPFQRFCFQHAKVFAWQLARKPLTEQQTTILEYHLEGMSVQEISDWSGIPKASVYDGLHKIEHNGWLRT